MLITNIKLFDGTSDNLVEDSSIWIEDNLIRYAGPSKKLRDVPDNIQTIDGNGLFIMPGMVEASTIPGIINNPFPSIVCILSGTSLNFFEGPA